MRRKRDTTPEALLRRVIAELEESDELNHRSHRAALLTLLSAGPLMTSDTLLQELDTPTSDVSSIRAELVAFLRQAVRLRGMGMDFELEYGLALDHTVPMQFFALATPRHRVFLFAKGSARDIAILQLLVLLDQVGMDNVRNCAAPNCPRLFVKTYRREFCSARCQQRTIKARLRQAARLQKEQQARARRRRISKGSR
jgi:hypothetical protein